MISKYVLLVWCVFPIFTDMGCQWRNKILSWDVCDISTRCLYGIRLCLSELSFMWEELDASGNRKKLRKLNKHLKEHKLKLILSYFHYTEGGEDKNCRGKEIFVLYWFIKKKLILPRNFKEKSDQKYSVYCYVLVNVSAIHVG